MSVYTLEEAVVPCDPGTTGPTASSWWSPRGLTALLRPLPGEEGSMDGGLRRGSRVLCTWAEGEVLRPGLVYVVKAFRPEVVRAWQRHFHGSTALQLCLRVRTCPHTHALQESSLLSGRNLCPTPCFLVN